MISTEMLIIVKQNENKHLHQGIKAEKINWLISLAILEFPITRIQRHPTWRSVNISRAAMTRKQSIPQCTPLAKKIAKRKKLLAEEAEARRAAEQAGVQAMWIKFQNTIAEEEKKYLRLEESRKALLAQQRTAQLKIEHNRVQIQEIRLRWRIF
ncbi:hypothetical protein C8J56DRAFT_884028 [Mycena floridula]|nr:hypothetical protein C8J56DRAFT_884028 [Mycena floridula]